MRKITKWEGGAELARNIYLDLEIAIPTLFGRGDRATYQRVGNKESLVLASRCFENITAASLLGTLRSTYRFTQE
jgi:hypothetical protein